MYFRKFRFNALCEIFVFICIQLVFVFVVSICRNKKIKNKKMYNTGIDIVIILTISNYSANAIA